MSSRWFKPAGSTASGAFDVAIGPQQAGWEHTGLYAATLAPGVPCTFSTGEAEWLVLPLSGSLRVECGGKILFLTGRRDVFSGTTDFAYVPVDSQATVTSSAGARVAFPHAKASATLPFRRIPAEEVTTELRGAGPCSRQVNNFGIPAVLDADSIIACEVITPAGNWSSYPPHKHDEDRPDQESALEEIYYFEMRAEPGSQRDGGRSTEAVTAAKPFGYQRVYGTAARPINVLAEVRSGDVVLVPHGWHGPTMAPPGYDMYYLNVMAGPGRREWLICDDPDHAFVRDSWSRQSIDPRLPLGARR